MVAVMVACRTQDRLTDAGGDMTGFRHKHTHTRTHILSLFLSLERQRFSTVTRGSSLENV